MATTDLLKLKVCILQNDEKKMYNSLLASLDYSSIKNKVVFETDGRLAGHHEADPPVGATSECLDGF